MNTRYHAKKELGVWSLAFMGLCAMLGSGWLLSSYFVYQQAGLYAPYAWALGYVMVLVIALSFAETCSLIDHDGATVILPRVSHGYLLSALFGFFGLISWVALIPIEVAATLQYLSYFISGLYTVHSKLTPLGLTCALGLVGMIALINSFAMLWMKRLNNFIFTPIKIGIPCCVIAYGLLHAYHQPQQILVHTHSIKGVFLAIPLGVVFSFNAFKNICVIAGRAKDPNKTIIRALLLSLTACFLIYVGLQFAFDLNVTALVLQSKHSPYAVIVSHAALMLVLLYIGAVSSPFTANVFNLNAGNFCCYRMARFGYLPRIFTKKNRAQQYIIANVLNTLVACFLVYRSASWHAMVQQLTCVMVITYAAAPVALVIFRRSLGENSYVLRLPCGPLIGFLGFVFSSLMMYWCGEAALVMALKALCAVTFFIVVYHRWTQQKTPIQWQHAWWFFVWIGGIAVVGHYGHFGGLALWSYMTSMLAVVGVAVISYGLLVVTAPSKETVQASLVQIQDTLGAAQSN